MVTPQSKTGQTMQPAIANLFSCIASDLQAVETKLQVGVSSRSTLVEKAGKLLLSRPGKRLRPAILILTAKLCGYQSGTRHITLATVAEYMHTATLIHDDIVDQAATRRGLPAAHRQWGTQTAVLVGDFLYSRAIEMLVHDGDLRVLEAFADATVRMSEGEILEVEMANNPALSYDEYLTIITCKTAALLAATSRAGALIADAVPEEIEAMGAFGLHLGLAFQMVDDALDFAGHQEYLGKPTGQDLREGKITYPVIHTMQHGSLETQEMLWQLFVQDTMSDQHCADITALVKQHNGVEATLEQARLFAEAAQAYLEPFPQSPAKHALRNMLHFIHARQW